MVSGKAFTRRDHSLRISASRVSALTGYHPFANLPELFLLDHVYQGRSGQDLLRMDAELLGLTFVSEEEALFDLARRASKETSNALATALSVKTGGVVARGTLEASKIKERVLTEARRTKRLNPRELDVLTEGVRSFVDTGFGTHHEGEALDLYERRCGWDVRDRNSAILSWPFRRVDDGNDDAAAVAGDGGSRKKNEEEPPILTIEPMGKARKMDWTARETSMSNAADATTHGTMEAKSTTRHDETNPIVLLDDDSEDEDEEDRGGPSADSTSAHDEAARIIREERGEEPSSSSDMEKSPNNDDDDHNDEEDRSPPYLTIHGSVDGVRDELYFRPSSSSSTTSTTTTTRPSPPPRRREPNPRHDDNHRETTRQNDQPEDDGKDDSGDGQNNDDDFGGGGDDDDDDDDRWDLRKIVVECKHRMKRATQPPPLYDQIQTVAYCLMYDTDQADLIQVLRKEKKIPRRPKKKKQQPSSPPPPKEPPTPNTNEPETTDDKEGDCSRPTFSPEAHISKQSGTGEGGGVVKKGRSTASGNRISDYFVSSKKRTLIAAGDGSDGVEEDEEEKEGSPRRQVEKDSGEAVVDCQRVDSTSSKKRRPPPPPRAKNVIDESVVIDDDGDDDNDHDDEEEKAAGSIEEKHKENKPREEQHSNVEPTKRVLSDEDEISKDAPPVADSRRPSNSTRKTEDPSETGDEKMEEISTNVPPNDGEESRRGRGRERPSGGGGRCRRRQRRRSSSPDCNEHHQQEPQERPRPQENVEIDIVISRISLDDPLWQHRKHWNSTILPRLRSFVDAVYRVRSDEGKRYRFLYAIASASAASTTTTTMDPTTANPDYDDDDHHDHAHNRGIPNHEKDKKQDDRAGSSLAAWDLLHDEIPWLRHCDTAYHRLLPRDLR